MEEAKGMKHKPEKNQWKCFRGCERISPGLFSLFPSAVIRINKIQQRKKKQILSLNSSQKQLMQFKRQLQSFTTL